MICREWAILQPSPLFDFNFLQAAITLAAARRGRCLLHFRGDVAGDGQCPSSMSLPPSVCCHRARFPRRKLLPSLLAGVDYPEGQEVRRLKQASLCA